MNALASRVILSWGWSRALIATLAGAVGALAMPPFGLVPALAVSLTVAVWLIDGTALGADGRSRLGRTLLAAGLTGWCWGFGYFVAGLWWLGSAFLVEADQFAWALPFGVLGLPAVLALFFAFGFALARLLWSGGAARLLALAVGLAVAEWLRGHLFTGFPWNTLGMALGQNLWLMQGASILGLYGLTLVTVPVLAAPAALGTGETSRARLVPTVAAGLVLAALAAYGAGRVPAGAVPTVAGVKLRLMQPNLPQDAKFRPENRDEIMRRYLTLSDRATSPTSSGVADATHLIWPESAFPFLLHRDPRALAQIAALLPPGVTLVTGAARMDEPLPGEAGRRFYNSIQVVGDDGTIGGTYDKGHLVPFGEYFPGILDAALRRAGIRQFVHVPGGFEPAASRLPLTVRGLPPLAATICYEAIFPEEIAAGTGRPGLILNVTNDAWFGRTPGPYQHFAQARLRSVEQGLPLVRAANTGISAVVDPYGRVVASLPLMVEGVLDGALPQALRPTLYAQWGEFLFAGLTLCCVGFASVACRRRRPSAAAAAND
ncbi:MAG TPA: apolipoprotein N-acyltransferase [Beijerinckiaceae bacterium]|jgi:apolipoprotein N-acyltransferase